MEYVMFDLIAVERGCNSSRAGSVGMRPIPLTLVWNLDL